MVEIRFRTYVMSDQFKAGFPIDQHEQFTAECQERDVGMRAKTTFARDTDAGVGRVCKAGCDLGSCGIKLRSLPLNFTAERTEPIRIQPQG